MDVLQKYMRLSTNVSTSCIVLDFLAIFINATCASKKKTAVRVYDVHAFLNVYALGNDDVQVSVMKSCIYK